MPVSRADADFVRELVHRRSAIVLDDGKEYLIETRLTPLAQDQGLASVAELISKARSGSRGMDAQIVEAITTHETSFFRDVQPFAALGTEVLPALRRSRAAARRLNIWSAACSTGQEPYSIALTLLDRCPDLAEWTVRILATDISERVLAAARDGTFSQLDMNRGLPAGMLVKYFARRGLHWQIDGKVRDMVEFRQLNLIDPWVLDTPPDIVFLRNVLIYFDLPAKRAILDRVRRHIAPDGVLFLGAAETTMNVTEGWERVVSGNHAYYRART